MTRMLHRPAYTLIELAVVLTVSSALMVVSVGWIHQSMKFGSIVRTRHTHHQNLLRLGSQFRYDVLHGVAMKVEADDQLVIDMGNSQQVVYSITAASIARTTSDGDQIKSRDAFPLATTTVIRLDTSELPSTISLVVNRGRGLPVSSQEISSIPSEPRPTDLYVRASVGRYDFDSGAKP